MTTHVLSFDVEEYYHVHAFAEAIDPVTWDAWPSRVVPATERILDLLGPVRATFFILGDVARRNPRVVQRIARAGHEIASHGDRHQRVDQMTPDDFRDDVRTARQRIEGLIGRRVTAYRAPSFSITPATPWAHEILVEEGHTVDSSAAAGRRGRSTEPRQPTPYTIATPSGPLTEFPLPALAGLPIGGGGYLRLLPLWLTRIALRQLPGPFCVYLHPWEFDTGQPRVRAGWLQNLRHRVGLRTTDPKLRRLLAEYRFGAMEDVLSNATDQRLAA